MQDATKTNVDLILGQIQLTYKLTNDSVHKSIKQSKLSKCIANINEITFLK